MFVMVTTLQLNQGVEDQFKAWFAESNKVLSGSPGFISRHLLKSADGNNNYTVIVEHQSKESFIKMHQSPEHEKVHPKGRSFMSADPIKRAFTIVES